MERTFEALCPASRTAADTWLEEQGWGRGGVCLCVMFGRARSSESDMGFECSVPYHSRTTRFCSRAGGGLVGLTDGA